MRFTAAFTSVLLATAASAAEIRVVSDERYPVRAVDVLERRFEDLANQYLDRRQTTPFATNQTMTSNASKVNITAWNEQTSQACSVALARLDFASNPSGTCICYNLPSLDTATGVFEADLRLFKISEPTGEFTGIPPQNIEVGLSYAGASVSPISASRLTQRNLDFEDDELVEKRAAAPADLELLQAYLFLGKIDPAKMSPSMTMAQLEALVMPVLTLTGKNSSGAVVSTNVSSNEAAFVTGVFSNQVVMSEFAVAQVAVYVVSEQLQNGTVAFVLPGVQILIFPVGLVVTSVWLLLGFIAYGYGTLMRIRYADNFKRRTAAANNMKRTI